MTKKSLKAQTKQLSSQWTNNRFNGIVRPYSPEDVVRLRPRLQVEHTHAKVLAQKLWKLLNTKPYVKTFGAMIGPQAVQMVREGAQSIYLSGWQVAAGANKSGQVYPDMSLYPVDSAPALVTQLINALQRADEIDASDGHNGCLLYTSDAADE